MRRPSLQPEGLPPHNRESRAARREVHRPIVTYPGFDVLSQIDHWDATTRRVILDRITRVPPIRFFTPEELPLVERVVERVLPQDDRGPDQRVPIVPWIDHILDQNLLDGYRFADLPPMQTAWRLFLQGVQEVARIRFDRDFLGLDGGEQDAVLQAIADGTPPGKTWEELHAARFWVWVFMQQLVGVYYAHPTAWNEIGFGGPAYPRGYFALSFGYPEPWETREARLDAPEG